MTFANMGLAGSCCGVGLPVFFCSRRKFVLERLNHSLFGSLSGVGNVNTLLGFILIEMCERFSDVFKMLSIEVIRFALIAPQLDFEQAAKSSVIQANKV